MFGCSDDVSLLGEEESIQYATTLTLAVKLEKFKLGCLSAQIFGCLGAWMTEYLRA